MSDRPIKEMSFEEAMRRNREALAVEDNDLIAMCYMSEDFRHGMEAFLAKRKPDWRGR